MVDLDAGVLGIEWIEGEAVRHILPGGGEDGVEGELPEADDEGLADDDEVDPLIKYGIDHGKFPYFSLVSYKPISPAGYFPLSVLLLRHLGELMVLIGNELAKMHLANIIHGDLTTSNMMLRRKPNAAPPAEIVSSCEIQ